MAIIDCKGGWALNEGVRGRYGQHWESDVGARSLILRVIRSQRPEERSASRSGDEGLAFSVLSNAFSETGNRHKVVGRLLSVGEE